MLFLNHFLCRSHNDLIIGVNVVVEPQTMEDGTTDFILIGLVKKTVDVDGADAFFLLLLMLDSSGGSRRRLNDEFFLFLLFLLDDGWLFHNHGSLWVEEGFADPGNGFGGAIEPAFFFVNVHQAFS